MKRRLIALPAVSAIFAAAFSAAAAAESPAPRIREAFATTPAGIRIHYLEAGPAAERALVLIPGWRLPASLWSEQIAKFGAAMRVIAIDPRSQGASTKTRDGNTPEDRAGDLHDVLASLGVRRPVLVGWSQGAQDVSAYLAAFGSGSVDGVVLVDSPVSAGPAEIELRREFSKVILSGITTFAKYPEQYSEGMVRSIFRKAHPDLDLPAIVRATMQTPTDTAIAMLVSDIFGADRRPALARLDRPALVVASSESPLIDAEKEMAATIRGAKFVAIPGTGHAVFVDAPQEFDDALAAFLRALPPAEP